jgi:hypothetical protein
LPVDFGFESKAIRGRRMPPQREETHTGPASAVLSVDGSDFNMNSRDQLL